MDVFYYDDATEDNLSYYQMPFSPDQYLDVDVYGHHWDMYRCWLRTRIESCRPCSANRLLLEEDERFYMTFPGARRAAILGWMEELGMLSVQHHPEHVFPVDTGYTAAPMSENYGHYSTHYYPGHATSTRQLPHAPPPQSSYSTLRSAYPVVHQEVIPVLENATVTSLSCEVLPVESHMIVPSQGRPTYRVGTQVARSQSADLISTSASGPADRSTLNSPSRAFLDHYSSLSPSRSPSLPQAQYTGDWETDALAAEAKAARQEMLHVPKASYPPKPQADRLASSDGPPVEAGPTRRHHLTYKKQRHGHSQAHPYVRRRGSPPTGKQGRTPPIEPVKRGKPVGEGKMACLFCRGRKIACQPPPAEQQDKTCNQCKRRSQHCRYPTENRRGMRRRKSEMSVEEIVEVDDDA